MNIPKGRRPKHIKSWLNSNGEEEWPVVTCCRCNRWMDEIDKYAPYYTDQNRCYKCDGKRKFSSLNLSVHSKQELKPKA